MTGALSGGMIFTSADVFLACVTVIKAGQYVSVNHLSFPIPPSISLGLGGIFNFAYRNLNWDDNNQHLSKKTTM